MRLRAAVLLLFALAALAVPAAEESEPTWRWFTVEPRAFRPLLADPREAQVRVGYLYSDIGKSFLELGFGGQLGIVRREDGDRVFEIGVRGVITTRFQFGSKSFDLQNSDIIGGIATSYRAGPHAVELLLAHQSSHLGDDVTIGRTAINYSFESARLVYAQQIVEALRLYAGIDVKLRADPSRLRGKTTFIAGGDWHFLPILPRLVAGLDVRFKGEHDYRPNLAGVLAYELGSDDKAAFRQRVFFELFEGYSNLGQFDFQRELYGLFGIGFTL